MLLPTLSSNVPLLSRSQRNVVEVAIALGMAGGRGQRHGLRDPRLVAEVEVRRGRAVVDPRVERLRADAGEHTRLSRRWRTPRRRRHRRARRARHPGRAAGCPSRSRRGSRRPRRRPTAHSITVGVETGVRAGRVGADDDVAAPEDSDGSPPSISPQPSTRPTVPGVQAAVSVAVDAHGRGRRRRAPSSVEHGDVVPARRPHVAALDRRCVGECRWTRRSGRSWRRAGRRRRCGP